MTDVFDLVAITVGIALGVAVLLFHIDVLKRPTKAKGKATRVVAITGLAYFPFLMGWIAFTNGHAHGLAGQALGRALYNQFVPFHEPEVDSHPLMILFYALVILANLNAGLLLMRAVRKADPETSTKNNDANTDTTTPPAD